jgi:hypothetical protein
LTFVSDAYDDPSPAAHELERENREIRRTQRLGIAGITSWIVATVVWCVWTTPIDFHNATDADWSFGNLVIAAIAGALVYGVLYGLLFTGSEVPTTRKLVAVGAVIPVALVVVGVALRPGHLVESRSLTAFTAYTGHFPRNALGDAYIADVYKNTGWVCAKQIRTRDTHFCTVVWTGEKYPRNFHVAGGYRFRERDQDIENTGLPINTFDCFGAEKDTCD